MLGAARGPAEESTFRRAFALVSPDVLDRVLGAWLHTRAVQAGGRLVIAIDGKAVRGAKDKTGKAPHLVAALAHGIGAALGQAAVDEKPNEIPAVRGAAARRSSSSACSFPVFTPVVRVIAAAASPNEPRADSIAASFRSPWDCFSADRFSASSSGARSAHRVSGRRFG